MQWIRRVYLYLVALISLIIVVFGSIQLINLGLKQWVFTKADQNIYAAPITCAPSTDKANSDCKQQEPTAADIQRQKDMQTSQKQSEAANAIAMIVVGSPVFYFHFKLARKEQ